MESNRQKKIAGVLQKDLAQILLRAVQNKHEVAQLTRNQLRRMPELEFFVDDSLEYLSNIEKSLKGEENPIQNPELLIRRKKS